MTALAVVLGFGMIAAVLYVLGSRWLEILAMDVGGGESASSRPRSRAPAAADSDDEDEEPDFDLEEEDEEAMIDAVRRMNEMDALMLQAWVEEQRAEGREEEDIQAMLDGREPVVSF